MLVRKVVNEHQEMLVGRSTMMSDGTQFSVKTDVKNELDRFKAVWKQDILARYKKKKRFVTNTDAIQYLLDFHRGVLNGSEFSRQKAKHKRVAASRRKV
jgi:hypothetical protein